MRRRFRFLRLLKWAGTLACLLILAAFVMSACCGIWWSGFSGNQLILDRGNIFYAQDPFGPFFVPNHIVEWHGLSASFEWPAWDFNPLGNYAVLPLWLPFLIALAPTLLLWFLDRRRVPPGHCRKCRYNLAGNTTGRCSECGTPFAPAAQP